MTQLVPLTLDDNTVIYVEATDDVAAPIQPVGSPEGPTRTSKGASDQVLRGFQAMQGTICAYTCYTLNAFRSMAGANVDKVILEFGIKIGGEAGVPYVTKGTAESNLKITVECSFPENS
ncbi:hypothetical protein XM38_001110 [Halomicronema hongdechloris C2206]|uniref:Trypsin-co-occurring domain-containing protein n=1 Tax=Halomicronema hongdechloris C2206 TaxID=1641165 RepID=A0A1Z3HG07_9CYAN|nr:CU044_2847 family protein [Halomicronema hongdechloris]ASC69185.1 hypothetical protein XM38_001110 [Halomicronema hongdechloris C2206]